MNQAFSKIWIVAILVISIAGGILVWQYFRMPKEEVKAPEEKVPEEIVQDETADWKTYRNEEYGFEIKYPENFYLVGQRISSEPNPWAQNIGPHEKVTISFYRIPNYKKYSLGYLLSHDISFRGGTKVRVGEEWAIRKIDEQFPSIVIYFLRDDDYIYAVQGVSGTKEYFNQYRELIEEIENTFRFIEKKEVLEPTGVESAGKTGWWIYGNKKYKYAIEFPDNITLEDMDNVLGRVSENSRRIKFYLEEHPAIPFLNIEVSPSYDLATKPFSREEFINQFVTIRPKFDLGDGAVIDATDIFNQMLSTFRFLE